MKRFQSRVNVNSEDYKKKFENMLDVCKDLQEKLDESCYQGSVIEKYNFSFQINLYIAIIKNCE